MTERELQADLRALIRRWEGEAEQLKARNDPYGQYCMEQLEYCIADVKELLP